MVRGARNCPFTDFSVIIFRKKLTTTRIAPLSLNSPMRLVIARLNSLLLMIELVRPNLTKARPANEGGGFSWIGRLLSRQSYPERDRGDVPAEDPMGSIVAVTRGVRSALFGAPIKN